jgi:CubicO group peptidase (beta-lactamase class C family)/pimeloyl-ACP methyl ester carboxylesterase
VPALLLTLLTTAMTCGVELRADEERADKLDVFIRQGMQDWALTGLAVAVVKDDRVVFQRGYGVRRAGTKASVDEQTVFQIGSASKPLTASGIALLVQEGSASWDKPIRDTWPAFRALDPTVTREATLRDILCHRTGVGKDESLLYYAMPTKRSQLLIRLPEVQQAAPFRTEMRYSNVMYTAAGQVVEQVTGQDWDEHMSKRIFQPLGMSRTTTSVKALAKLENVAVPHVRVGDETFVTEFADQDNIGPAASINSSVADLAQWLLLMTNGGRHQAKQFLDPAIVGEMLKPHVLMPADPVHGEHVFCAYGLGFMLWDYHGHRIAAHSGMSGHSLAMIGLVPEKRVGVVVLANHRRCLFHYAAFRRALDLYCGMPPIDLDSANKKLLAKFLAREAEAAKRRAAERNRAKKPALPFLEYRGSYQGKFDLVARVEMEAGSLILRYGNHVADVTHWHDDTFRARLRQRRLAEEQDWWLTFSVAGGAVAKLHIDSQHDVHGDFVPQPKVAASASPPAGQDQPKPPGPLARAPEGELRRRALFGAQLGLVTKGVQARQKLEDDAGVVLERIFPDTAAAEGEFKPGDVILGIGGTRVTDVPTFLANIAEKRAGDVVSLEFVRDGVKAEKRVTLKELPREKGDGYDVIYGSVTSRGVRLRTILTRPKGQGRHPAVMLLQGGHTCFSIDNPVGEPHGFTRIARSLAGQGFVTLRVERPGCGDSEGGPLRDVDFDTELEGYKQALGMLKQIDFLDRDRVFLFGHSMGGIMAPLMAVELPVRGIAVYGTTAETWFESVVGQRRRLASLDGTNPAVVNDEVLLHARFWYGLSVEKKTPREIREQSPDIPKRIWDLWVIDDKYVADRHYKFYHQIAQRNLTEVWTKVAATRLSLGEKVSSAKAPAEPVYPRVLSIWGTADWLAARPQADWIADVVNRVQPGNGLFFALDSVDHSFFRAASPEESYRLFKPAKGVPPGEFNPTIVKTLRGWLDETARRS